MASQSRRREVEAFLRHAATWAATRENLAAAALVGSWAAGTAREDSDVDLVLLTHDPSAYTMRDEWIRDFAPGARIVRTRAWGAIVERRLLLPSALEIEIGVGRPSWARADAVDPGTRCVVRGGIRTIFDPDGLLKALVAAC